MSPHPVFHEEENAFSTVLLIMRHGIAEEREEMHTDAEDAARALTKKGRRRVEEMAELLRTIGLAPTHYLTSPRVRAMETAQIVHRVFGARTEIREVASLDVNGTWEDFVADVDRLMRGQLEIVLATGHEPNCSIFAGHALAPELFPLEMKKGAVAALEWQGPIAPSGAKLLGYLTPRLARR